MLNGSLTSRRGANPGQGLRVWKATVNILCAINSSR